MATGVRRRQLDVRVAVRIDSRLAVPAGLTDGFRIAGILHVVTDFPLHHDDGRQHPWPISDWVFAGPISHWNPSRHGGIVGQLEGMPCLAIAVWTFRRFRSPVSRVMMVLLAAYEVLPALWPILLL